MSETVDAPPAEADWMPAELRADPALKDFKDLAGLAKSYKDAQSFIGADKATVLKIPKDEAAPEWGDIYARLGRPEKPDGYNLSAPEGFSPELLGAFAARSHELGLSSKQAAKMMEFYTTAAGDAQAAHETKAKAAFTAGEQAMRAEWGQAYEDRLHRVRQMIVNTGGEEAFQAFADFGGNNPAILKALGALAMKMAEPAGLNGGSGGGMGSALTPEQAKSRMAEKRRDPEFSNAYLTKDHPAHADAVREMSALYRAAAGGV